MTETSSGEVPTASLVGALAVFPLNDVLGLLAETGQRGELQVVGHGVDGHLWIDSKDLVGATLEGANTLTQAVFELMLLDEGWFYFTSDQVPPAGQVQHQSVTSVINEVVPQVQEWRDLLSRVPLDAEVRMAPTTPGPEVQIRADQWHVLTTVGTSGRTVSSVVEQLEDDNVVIVRLIRELADAGLIAISTKDDPSQAPAATTQAAESTADIAPGATSAPAGATPLTASPDDLFVDTSGAVPPPPPGFVTASPGAPAVGIPADVGSLAEDMPIMPPPVSADPWAPPGSSSTNSGSTYGQLS
jgi:hypothetical protein